MAVTIAVVATGAMGAGIGGRLVENGARVLTTLAGRSDASQKRARAAGMEDASDEAMAAADLFLSVVPPDQAVPLAQRMAGPIGRSNHKPAYLDMNAINPATAQGVADALAPSGAAFVDGGIIGGPPKPGGTGPTLYLSGPAADAAALLGRHGLVVKQLDGGIGAASALKMSYAGMTKGFTALGTAMIGAARRHGVAEALAAELASSQPEFLDKLRRGVPDMLPKAYRWVPEMHEIAGFIGEDRPASAIYAAIARLYKEVAADQAAGGAEGADLTGFFAMAKG